MEKILNAIGINAPYILFILSIFLLRKLNNHLIFYVLGFGLNNILNIILKLLIKEPRPKDNTTFIEFIENRLEYGKYGMPSGHAQNCFFSLAYITLVLNQPYITLFYIFISFITLIQKYERKEHTLIQLFVGSAVGIAFAYLFYFFSGKYILGKANYKKDDGFIL